MPSVSVVIPTFNERENIAILARQIHEVLGQREHEILVVDDNSPDGTGQEVLRLSKELPQVRLLTKEKREGIGAALRYGYDRARGDILLSTDADLSFKPADMPRLLAKIEAGADLALGCRHMTGGDYEATTLKVRLKSLVSKTGNRVVRAFTGLDISDYSANFRAIRRSVWNDIHTRENTNSLLLEMILKVKYGGWQVEQVPVHFADRIHGESKLNLWVEAPKFLLKLVKYALIYRFGKREYLALALMLSAFAAASAYGMRADLPFTRSATEGEQVYYAVKFGSGDFNPHFFLHPPLFAYFLFGLYGVAFLVGRFAGFFHSVGDFERLFFTDPTFFFLLARGLALAMALGGIAIFYGIAKSLYRGASVALLAAGFLCSSVLHVVSAHYASTDVPMLFLSLLAFTQIVRVLREGAFSQYALAGLLIGLATATKYNAAWLAVPLLLAHALGQKPRDLRSLAAGLGLIPVGFLIGCPFALLDWRTFLSSYRKLRWTVTSADYQFASYHAQGSKPLYLVATVFPSMAGWPLTAASAAGLIYAFWRRKAEDILLAVFVLTYTAYLGTWSVIKARYFIHVLPFFLLLAARACVAATEKLPAKARAGALVLAGLLLVLPPWRQIIRFDQNAAQSPIAKKAKEWVEQNVPPGTGIAVLSELPINPNPASIRRRLAEIRKKRLGQAVRLERLARYAPAMKATYDVWDLPYPWRDDFEAAKFDFEALKRSGARYFILTSEMDQYLADPARYPAQAEYNAAVLRYCELVKAFRQYAPDVEPETPAGEESAAIYKLRSCLSKDRHSS